jgi:LmbE family N-acetylglucosaminyl deacetylase
MSYSFYKLLAVLAHPDDESLGLGGTLAKYAAEGVETTLVCATRGERGWFGPEDQNPGLTAIGKIRGEELRCAADCLGLREVHFLDTIDGELDQANPDEVIAKIVTHIRRIRPQVVVTFPPDGHYGHPDHIAIGQFCTAALVCAADAGYRDLQQNLPHRVPKFYYVVDSKDFVQAVASVMGEITFKVDGLKRTHVGWEEWAITTRIDTQAYFETALKAILCHQSQLGSLSGLLELPRERLVQFLAEGTFIRVYSLVNGGRMLEDDLFAGLRA